MNYGDNKYRATVVRWVDGDTVELQVDLGQKVYVKGKYRLARIDAPEIRKRAGVTDKEKAAGLALLADLEHDYPPGTKMTVSTSKQGKYGRYIVEIYPFDNDENLSDMLLKNGRVKPYHKFKAL